MRAASPSPGPGARMLQLGSSTFADTATMARSGRQRAKEKLRPSQLMVSSDRQVEGIRPPVTNVYHVLQTLKWMSERRDTIEDRESWGEQALGLVRKLAEDLNALRGSSRSEAR